MVHALPISASLRKHHCRTLRHACAYFSHVDGASAFSCSWRASINKDVNVLDFANSGGMLPPPWPAMSVKARCTFADW